MLADRTYNQNLSLATPMGYFHVKVVYIKIILSTAYIARKHINHESTQNNFGYYTILLFYFMLSYTHKYANRCSVPKKRKTIHIIHPSWKKKLNVCIVLYLIGEFANIAQIPMCVCICLSIVDFISFIRNASIHYLFHFDWIPLKEWHRQLDQNQDQQMNYKLSEMNHVRQPLGEIKRTIERKRQKLYFFMFRCRIYQISKLCFFFEFFEWEKRRNKCNTNILLV